MPDAPHLTFHQPHPSGRILLILGQHEVGAVFPPVGQPRDSRPWVWRFWLGTACPEGRAKTEKAAKKAILGQAKDWLRKAGVGG